MPSEDKTIVIKHSRRYSGYLLHITKVVDGPVRITQGNSAIELQNVVVAIAVETPGWEIEFAGAFIVSKLTDRVWRIRDVPDRREDSDANPCVLPCGDGTVKPFLVSDEGARDLFKLGFGAFVHLYHNRFQAAAFTFGLGLAQDNRTTFYFGPTYRFGGKGALTIGQAFGPIARLPAGTQTGEVVTDRNVLNNLQTRTVNAWFFSLSYTFVDTRARLEDPFKPQ